MRTILFRGKKLGTNEWIEGFYLQRREAEYPDIYPSIMTVAHKTFYVRPETVSQYIGKSDITGKRIFEHDIVRLEGGSHSDKMAFKAIATLNGYDRSGLNYCFCDIRKIGVENIKIIGNIHDNPALVKEFPLLSFQDS